MYFSLNKCKNIRIETEKKKWAYPENNKNALKNVKYNIDSIFEKPNIKNAAYK